MFRFRRARQRSRYSRTIRRMLLRKQKHGAAHFGW
jgi:hypothetical protein